MNIKEGHELHISPHTDGAVGKYNVYHTDDEGNVHHVGVAEHHSGTSTFGLKVQNKSYNNMTDKQTVVNGLRAKKDSMVSAMKQKTGTKSHAGVVHSVNSSNLGGKVEVPGAKRKIAMKATDRLDDLVKMIEAELEKAEKLSKPPVSEAQRRAMHAAANGNSTLDIPKSVGKEFAGADKGGKLPEKTAKASKEEVLAGAAVGAIKGGVAGGIKAAMKAEDCNGCDDPDHDHKKDKAEKSTLDYSKFNKPAPKTPESSAPTIKYGENGAVTRKPGQTDSTFRTPKAKLDSVNTPQFKAHLAQQRAQYGVKKSDVDGVVTETLTKSMRSSHTDEQITEMLKCAMDKGMIHRNVFMEWQNFKTINPSILDAKIDGE